jgi:hypothetical protein
MNLRHAAAFALVGWYLMIPPGSGSRVDIDAPLNKWSVFRSFDTAAECKSQLAYQLNKISRKAEHQEKADEFSATRRYSVASSSLPTIHASWRSETEARYHSHLTTEACS